jgi:hypothetical protein
MEYCAGFGSRYTKAGSALWAIAQVGVYQPDHRGT